MNDAILTKSSVEQHCWKQDGCRLDDCCEKLAGSERSAGSPDQLFQPHCCEAVLYTTLQTDRQTDGPQDCVRPGQAAATETTVQLLFPQSCQVCINLHLRVTQEMPPVSADYAAITTTKTSLIGFSVDSITYTVILQRILPSTISIIIPKN